MRDKPTWREPSAYYDPGFALAVIKAKPVLDPKWPWTKRHRKLHLSLASRDILFNAPTTRSDVEAQRNQGCNKGEDRRA